MRKIEQFHDRLKKIGINITLVMNYPWIYLDTVNTKRVTERFEGNHGFTIAFMSAKREGESKFTDLRTIFKTIRKYTNKQKQ